MSSSKASSWDLFVVRLAGTGAISMATANKVMDLPADGRLLFCQQLIINLLDKNNEARTDTSLVDMLSK